MGEPADGPGWRAPMLAQLQDPAAGVRGLSAGDWILERKLDGLRCVSVRRGDHIELWSRNHLPFDRRFPQVAAALRALPADSFVLDGEIVAYLGDRTSFELLQSRATAAQPVYVVFDVLHLLGRDTTALSLRDRQELLRLAIDPEGGVVRRSEQLSGDPEELLRSACEAGWEGLVAKRAASTYRPGRSPDWRKLKCSPRQELVIGGWSQPSGSRTGFGALLVGYYEDGTLRYAGKVGSGFDEPTLRELHRKLCEIEQASSPFADPTREKGVHWVVPELVAEIEFSEWTREGRMRHPRFLGIRPDKAPGEVRRERPVPPDPAGGS